MAGAEAAGLEETAEESGRTGRVYLARPAQETPSTRWRSGAQTRVREVCGEEGREGSRVWTVCPRSESLTEPEKSVVGKGKTTTPMIDSASDLFKLDSCATVARAFLQR